MHPAEAFLRSENNPNVLSILYKGHRRRLFFRQSQSDFLIMKPGSRKYGYVFQDWQHIEKVFYPASRPESNDVMKYQRLAAKASFTNGWIRKIAAADPSIGLYENGITTGNRLDGKCVRLSTIEKYCGIYVMESFRQALRNRQEFRSGCFDFGNYDGRLWVYPDGEEGDVRAGFNKEYHNCCNGYYYLLINDDTMIGYDID